MSSATNDHIGTDIIHQVLSDMPGGISTKVDINTLVEDELNINEALPGLVRGEATALLLDINNLYKRSRSCGFRIDYGKLNMIFNNRCDLRHCAAFSAVDSQDRNAQSWVDYMNYNGYSVVTRELNRYTDQKTGQLITKGNMDIEMTIAAMKLSPAFGHVIIGSCDGDFIPLIEELREGNFRKVSVLGIKSDDASGMSESLIRSANHFYDLNEIKDFVSYHGSGTRHGRTNHST